MKSHGLGKALNQCGKTLHRTVSGPAIRDTRLRVCGWLRAGAGPQAALFSQSASGMVAMFWCSFTPHKSAFAPLFACPARRW